MVLFEAAIDRFDSASVESGARLRLGCVIFLRVRAIASVVPVAILNFFANLSEEGFFRGDARVEFVGRATEMRRIRFAERVRLLTVAVPPDVYWLI